VVPSPSDAARFEAIVKHHHNHHHRRLIDAFFISRTDTDKHRYEDVFLCKICEITLRHLDSTENDQSLSLSLSLSLSETTVSWRIFFDSFFFVSFFIVSFTSKEEEDKDRIEVTRHLLLYMKNHRNLELFSKKKKQ